MLEFLFFFGLILVTGGLFLPALGVFMYALGLTRSSQSR